mmetsp:Transcript_2130/g.13933  ORF Transcript_2130/g.13933 Transcript_2130/m.13933 type:complete len:246 (-) Transcript_2130:2141-2878(-)
MPCVCLQCCLSSRWRRTGSTSVRLTCTNCILRCPHVSRRSCFLQPSVCQGRPSCPPEKLRKVCWNKCTASRVSPAARRCGFPRTSAPSSRASLPAWDRVECPPWALHSRSYPPPLGRRKWLQTFLLCPWLDAVTVPCCCAAVPHVGRGTYRHPAVRSHPGTAVIACMADSCLLGHNHGPRDEAVQIHIALPNPSEDGSRDRWKAPPRPVRGPTVHLMRLSRKTVGLATVLSEACTNGPRTGLVRV